MHPTTSIQRQSIVHKIQKPALTQPKILKVLCISLENPSSSFSSSLPFYIKKKSSFLRKDDILFRKKIDCFFFSNYLGIIPWKTIIS